MGDTERRCTGIHWRFFFLESCLCTLRHFYLETIRPFYCLYILRKMTFHRTKQLWAWNMDKTKSRLIVATRKKNYQTDPATMPLHTDALFIPSLRIIRWHDSFESAEERSGAGLTVLRALWGTICMICWITYEQKFFRISNINMFQKKSHGICSVYIVLTLSIRCHRRQALSIVYPTLRVKEKWIPNHSIWMDNKNRIKYRFHAIIPDIFIPRKMVERLHPPFTMWNY